LKAGMTGRTQREEPEMSLYGKRLQNTFEPINERLRPGRVGTETARYKILRGKIAKNEAEK